MFMEPLIMIVMGAAVHRNKKGQSLYAPPLSFLYGRCGYADFC